VLDNHLVELGMQDKEFVLQVAWENEESFFDCSPRVRYKPQVTLMGKILLLQHSALGVPIK
jgi:hypothetical protein